MRRRLSVIVAAILGAIVCGTGIVLVFHEALSFRGWLVGNRLAFAGILLTIGVAVMVRELVRSECEELPRMTIPLITPVVPEPELPRAPPAPAQKEELFSVGSPAEPPKVDLPKVDSSQLSGDKSFMPKPPKTPSWLQHQQNERREMLSIGAA